MMKNLLFENKAYLAIYEDKQEKLFPLRVAKDKLTGIVNTSNNKGSRIKSLSLADSSLKLAVPLMRGTELPSGPVVVSIDVGILLSFATYVQCGKGAVPEPKGESIFRRSLCTPKQVSDKPQ